MPVPATVTVTPSSANLSALGETVQLTATVRDQHGNAMLGVVVSWSSSAPMVATMDATGLVTAAGNGSATVAATAGSARGIAAVTVSVPDEASPDRAALVALYEAAGGRSWEPRQLGERPPPGRDLRCCSAVVFRGRGLGGGDGRSRGSHPLEPTAIDIPTALFLGIPQVRRPCTLQDRRGCPCPSRSSDRRLRGIRHRRSGTDIRMD